MTWIRWAECFASLLLHNQLPGRLLPGNSNLKWLIIIIDELFILAMDHTICNPNSGHWTWQGFGYKPTSGFHGSQVSSQVSDWHRLGAGEQGTLQCVMCVSVNVGVVKQPSCICVCDSVECSKLVEDYAGNVSAEGLCIHASCCRYFYLAEVRGDLCFGNWGILCWAIHLVNSENPIWGKWSDMWG